MEPSIIFKVLKIPILFLQNSHFVSAPFALLAQLIFEERNPLFLGLVTALRVHRHF